jgi:hypothetical protein
MAAWPAAALLPLHLQLSLTSPAFDLLQRNRCTSLAAKQSVHHSGVGGVQRSGDFHFQVTDTSSITSPLTPNDQLTCATTALLKLVMRPSEFCVNLKDFTSKLT